MKNLWTYISAFLTGIIAGLLIFLKMKSPETIINDNQRIGKVKQRGDGSTQSLTLEKDDQIQTRKQKREEKKIERIRKRRERKEKLENRPP